MLGHYRLRETIRSMKMDVDHRYYIDWGEGEVLLPSVTTIMGPLNDFSRIPPRILESAAEHGKYVHSLTEILDKERPGGEFLDPGSVLPFYNRYVDTWREFKKRLDLQPVIVEAIVANKKLGYAGTLDRVFFCGKERCFYLADLTTSASPGNKPVQMTGYLEAFEDTYEAISKEAESLPTHLMTIQASNEGRFSESIIKASDITAPWMTFLSCLNIWNHRKNQGGGNGRR